MAEKGMLKKYRRCGTADIVEAAPCSADLEVEGLVRTPSFVGIQMGNLKRQFGDYDWLVRDSSGVLHVCPVDLFRLLFEPVGEKGWPDQDTSSTQ